MSDFQHDADWPSSGGGECNDNTSPSYAPPLQSAVDAFDLMRVAAALSKLGPVLWLDRRDRRAATSVTISTGGLVLFDHPALAVLARCTAVSAHTAITPRGPREWLCFRDASGHAQGKLYLLPDTDYFAWDEMNAGSRIVPQVEPTSRWYAHGAFLRGAMARLGSGWRGRLLTFEFKRLPWLRTLGASGPLRISLLGLELARAIARDESAELVAPLNTF